MRKRLKEKNSNCSDAKIILDLIHPQIPNITVTTFNLAQPYSIEFFFFEKKNMFK